MLGAAIALGVIDDPLTDARTPNKPSLSLAQTKQLQLSFASVRGNKRRKLVLSCSNDSSDDDSDDSDSSDDRPTLWDALSAQPLPLRGVCSAQVAQSVLLSAQPVTPLIALILDSDDEQDDLSSDDDDDDDDDALITALACAVEMGPKLTRLPQTIPAASEQ